MRSKRIQNRSKTPTWFVLDESRPLACFAGVWTTWHGRRGRKAKPVDGEHTLYGFLTTDGMRRSAQSILRRCLYSDDRGLDRSLDDRTGGRSIATTEAATGWHAADRRARREER